MLKVTITVDGKDVAVIDAARGRAIEGSEEDFMNSRFEYHCHAAWTDERTGSVSTDHFRVSHYYRDGGVVLANKMTAKLELLQAL
jgi:hypothetical protein